MLRIAILVQGKECLVHYCLVSDLHCVIFHRWQTFSFLLLDFELQLDELSRTDIWYMYTFETYSIACALITW